jgi:hypothetical protein
MAPRSRKDWIFAFDVAVLDLLARQPGVSNPDAYPLVAQPCAKHGRPCVEVVYGELLQHVCWAEVSPSGLAEQLLSTMLPRAPDAPGPGE